MASILSIQDLRIQFGKGEMSVQAVKSSNFSLPKGKTLGIVGESGSGKSVTSLALMRLLEGTSAKIEGEVWLEAEQKQDLLTISKEEMRKLRGKEIAMIFQEPMTSLNPVFRCGEQVSESLRLHKGMNKAEAKHETIRLFQQVELPRPKQMYDAYPHEISGGQKQRVMIAMAIACNPSILIADEPTTALDVTVQKSILQLLKNLQAEHQMSIIFISHDLGVIAEIADEVLVMYQGEIVEQGKVEEIFKQPQHPYTKGLLACRPPMDIRLERLPIIADFVEGRRSFEQDEAERAKRGKETLARHASRQKHLQQQQPILQVKNLKTYFPIRKGIFGRATEYVKAVDDVSFEVYPGETMGLVGESGCGKTTLGRSLLHLIQPTSGEVYFDGQALHQMNRNQIRNIRQQIQIIFQDPFSSLNPRIRVGDAIIEPMQVHQIGTKAERKERMLALLEKVGLEAQHANRYPHEFSGGQRQRICIARALALNPRFIVCDESVSALDVSVQAKVLNLLKALQEELQLTYIFISHDLSVVKFMSDRMMVMKEGKIVEMGDAEELYLSPQQAYTRTLIEAIPKGL